jgi:hypothetical protein
MRLWEEEVDMLDGAGALGREGINGAVGRGGRRGKGEGKRGA